MAAKDFRQWFDRSRWHVAYERAAKEAWIAATELAVKNFTANNKRVTPLQEHICAACGFPENGGDCECHEY